ncbi:MAG: hypothetical protein R6U96_02540 [Promethearchaeia archaeon]
MSEQINKPQKCRFCNRKVDFAYYCEECGMTCCSDCLQDEEKIIFVCQKCDSRKIEQNDPDGKICKDCGSSQIFKLNEKIKSCPKCGSREIINVFEKKETLEKQFLDLIKKTRALADPFQEIINETDSVRQRVQKVREPPIRCYHYPNIEPNLLKIYQFIIYLKENILEKIKTHFRYISTNIEYFFDIYNQPNSNIRIIEGILANLQKSYDTIQTFISKKLDGFSEKLEAIEEKLPFIQKVDDLFSSYKRFLNLAANEKPIFAIKTKLTNDEDRFKRNSGILFITNMDLSFVRKYGLINKKYELIFKAPVNDLIKLKEGGNLLFKKLIVEFSYGKYEFSISSDSIPTVVEYILLAKDFEDRVQFDEIAADNLHEMSLDVNNLISYIEEGINKFFSLKCKFNQKNTPHPQIQANINSSGSENQSFNHQTQQFKRTPSFSPSVPYQGQQYNREPSYQSEQTSNHYSVNQPSQIHGRRKDYPSNANGSHANRKAQSGQMNSHFNPPRQTEDIRPPYHLHNSPRYSKANKYYSDPHDPSRFQNYEPFEKTGEEHEFKNNDFTDRDDYFDERSVLMKKLRKVHNDQEFDSSQFSERSDGFPIGNSGVNGFNKNHLAPEFHSQFSNHSQPRPREYNFNPQENLRKKTLLLRKKRHNKMKNLESLNRKFKKGNMSRNKYNRQYNNIKRQVYLIDQELENLRESINTDSCKDKDKVREYFS